MVKLEKHRAKLLKSLAKANRRGLKDLEVKFTCPNDVNFFLHAGYSVTPIPSKHRWYKISTTSLRTNSSETAISNIANPMPFALAF